MGAPGRCLLALCLAFTLAGCRRAERAEAPALAPAGPPGPHDVAVLQVRDFGTIRIELLQDKAPGTVSNFEKLARAGFYDGTTFHRVIPGFVIQGGDPNSKDRDPRNDGQGGPGYRIKAEFNDTPHVRGTVSMARGEAPDSAGSQFFIVLADHHELDGHYTAFGRVVDGMDVADRIAAVEVDKYGRWGPPDRPMKDVVIESVRIEPPGEAANAGVAPAEKPAAPSAPGAGALPEQTAPAGSGFRE
jgi:cyclophilin family peptidyl-prolyl cis-trans isomerase